jgi:prepilin-type N-terminal cleavage/methylation domain-containing protein
LSGIFAWRQLADLRVMRSGLVLVELMIVLVITGLIASFAVPRLTDLSDRAAVRSETLRVVAALDAARGSAVRLDAVASLAMTATGYRVTAVVGTDTVVAWTASGPQSSGVTVSGTGTPLLFGPAGIAMGVSNRTITLSRGAAVRRVVVSKLGRITY